MSTLIVENKNNVCTIKLNRPNVRNAFQPEMITELTNAFAQIENDSKVRAVRLKGEGKSFCAGADLDWMRSMAKYNRQENITDSKELYKMFATIQDCSVPVVTEVHGHVMGGALGLLAVSDIVVAEETTQFCFSEARLGLAPAVISSFVKNKVSFSAMSRWFLTAEVFSSLEAQEMGLVHKVVEVHYLESTTQAMLRSICDNGPQAVRATKKLLSQLIGNQTNVEQLTTELIADLRVSDEGQEGLNSFFDKRKPSWKLNEGN